MFPQEKDDMVEFQLFFFFKEEMDLKGGMTLRNTGMEAFLQTTVEIESIIFSIYFCTVLVF